jgi:hypothetical protein
VANKAGTYSKVKSCTNLESHIVLNQQFAVQTVMYRNFHFPLAVSLVMTAEATDLCRAMLSLDRMFNI